MPSLGPNPDATPLPSRLDGTWRHLAATRQWRALVTFVETWAANGDVPAAARVAQGRALLELRQPDRAWIRLKDQVESGLPSIETGRIVVEALLQRGAPDQARELVGRLLAEHPDDQSLQALWDRASAPVAEPPSLQAWALEQTPSLPQGIVLAEALLSSGQTLNARGLLERLRRAWPDDERVSDLLWAIEGDFSTTASLPELVGRWGPILLSPAGDAEEENTESITQESARKTALDLLDELDDVAETASFPSLFRNAPPRPVLIDDPAPEVTQTVRWQPFLHLPEDSHDPESGDTRIVRVLHRDPAGPMHVLTPRVEADFDLEEFRREMGVNLDDPRPAEGRWAQPLEDEDDDRVVLKRREAAPRATLSAVEASDPTMTQVGREVAHLLGGKPPRTPAPPIARPDPSTDTPAPAAAVEADDVSMPPPERPAAPPPTTRPSPEHADTSASWWPWAVALVVVLVLGGVPIAVAAVWWALSMA